MGCAGFSLSGSQLSTYRLSRSECTSSPHQKRKGEKQVKQHDYTTSSQCDKGLVDEGLHHHNASKIYNFVSTIVYFTLVVCYHAQSKQKKGNEKREEGIAIYMCGM